MCQFYLDAFENILFFELVLDMQTGSRQSLQTAA